MTDITLNFPVRSVGPLICVWLETGSPAQPLVCKWVSRPESGSARFTSITREQHWCSLCA